MERIVLSSCKLSILLTPSFREIIFETDRETRFTRQQCNFILSEKVQYGISNVIEMLRDSLFFFDEDEDYVEVIEGYVARHNINYGEDDDEFDIMWELTIDELNFNINVEKCDDGNIKIHLQNLGQWGIEFTETLWNGFKEFRNEMTNYLNQTAIEDDDGAESEDEALR